MSASGGGHDGNSIDSERSSSSKRQRRGARALGGGTSASNDVSLTPLGTPCNGTQYEAVCSNVPSHTKAHTLAPCCVDSTEVLELAPCRAQHVCDYDGCGKAFSRKSNLTTHVNAAHT